MTICDSLRFLRFTICYMINTNQFDKDIKILNVLIIHFEKNIQQREIKHTCLFINILYQIQTIYLND